MAFYDDPSGDSQPYGRKPYEGGIVGPRRPSRFSEEIADFIVATLILNSKDWLLITAHRSFNGCAHDNHDTKEVIGWRQRDQAQAM
jgi:hypothetical protein